MSATNQTADNFQVTSDKTSALALLNYCVLQSKQYHDIPHNGLEHTLEKYRKKNCDKLELKCMLNCMVFDENCQLVCLHQTDVLNKWFWQYLVLSWPWPLTFWPQNLTGSCLCPTALSRTFGDTPSTSGLPDIMFTNFSYMIASGYTEVQTHGQPENIMPLAASCYGKHIKYN